jgi:type I restriction enzyme S subunit
MRDQWATGSIGDHIELERDQVGVTPGREYPIVGVLNGGRGLLNRPAVTSETTSYPRLNRVLPGRLLYRKLTAYEGAVAVAPDDIGEAFVSPEFPTFRCKDSLLPAYARLMTQNSSFWDELALLCKGVGGRRERLNPRDFLTMPVSVPTVAEQGRIVDVIQVIDMTLEAALSGAAAADELWWALCDALKEEAEQCDSVRLDAIAEISGGLTKNKKDFEAPDLVEVPYLRVANVLRRYLDLSDIAYIRTTPARVAALRLIAGDILLNEGGDKDKLGRGAVWRGELEDCIHQNHVFRARLVDSEFIPEFVSAWSNSFGKKWFETFGTQTTGIASINKSTLSRFPVPALPYPRQREWSDLLEEVSRQCRAYNEAATRLRTLRVQVLTALLSGEHAIPESYDQLLEV